MSEAATRFWIDTDARRWEDPLPGPFARSIRVLPLEAARERRDPHAARKIVPVQPGNALEVIAQRRLGDAQQRRASVAIAFALAHEELAPVEVDAATQRRTARSERNATTSGLPISWGCRLRWKRMKRRIQSVYASSVRRLR
jgi:hypothetical protein